MPAVFASLLMFLSAAAGISQEKKTNLYDDLNFPFPLTVPPQRIVSLAPNITETLFALKLGDRVVGVTRFCDFPPEARQKEKIGGLVDPSLEKIQALRPDLVIAFRGNPIGIVNKLRNLHFPVFVFDAGKSLDGLFSMVEKMGQLTFQEKTAAELLQTLRKRYQAVELALRNAAHEPTVFLSLHGQGLWTCGANSYLNDLLIKARGVNIAGRIARRWLNLTREELIHENPEAIIILARDQAAFRVGREGFLNDPLLKTVAAIRTNNIQFLDENKASRFGPRLIDALAEAARLLHPEIFKDRP
jgi:iron complex transport system substrate-binding protein